MRKASQESCPGVKLHKAARSLWFVRATVSIPRLVCLSLSDVPSHLASHACMAYKFEHDPTSHSLGHQGFQYTVPVQACGKGAHFWPFRGPCSVIYASIRYLLNRPRPATKPCIMQGLASCCQHQQVTIPKELTMGRWQMGQ